MLYKRKNKIFFLTKFAVSTRIDENLQIGEKFMKKSLKLSFVFILTFFAMLLNTNATTLDCSVTLRQGSTGESVKELQMLLNEKNNCNLAVDGIFGNLTRSCVRDYQSKHNLSVDGVVGKNTCSMLNGTSEIVRTYAPTKAVRGVIVVEEANIRKRATTSSQKISSAKLGTVVRIVGTTSNGWYRIKGTNNTYGYIRSDLVAKNCIMLDISQQRLYVYENGVRSWSTRVVTGNKGNHDTPVGSYVLNPANFQKATYLRGTNDDGSKYASYVDYWMPFITDRGIGFHDASWRTYDQFTTATYKGSGSHGCVNMQHEAAEKLFTSITETVNVVVRK